MSYSITRTLCARPSPGVHIRLLYIRNGLPTPISRASGFDTRTCIRCLKTKSATSIKISKAIGSVTSRTKRKTNATVKPTDPQAALNTSKPKSKSKSKTIKLKTSSQPSSLTPGQKPKTRSDQIDILSGKLCDDIIEYLKPSLEKHKGCILIDLHPGSCLWSQKLHDFLHPQRHILIEPDERYFTPIETLLNRPGSTYRHFPVDMPYHSLDQNFTKLLADPDMIPPGALKSEPSDDASYSLNPNMLIVGNLSRRYKRFIANMAVKSASPSYRYSSVVVQHMATLGLTRRLFNTSGSVRSLWWVPQADAPFLLPYNLRGKSSSNSLFQIAGHATEVVKVDDSQLSSSAVPVIVRGPGLEGARRWDVERRMLEDGTSIPRGRLPDYDPASRIKDLEKVYNPVLQNLCATCDELDDYLNNCLERLKIINALPSRRKTAASVKRENELLSTLEFPQASIAVRHARDNRTLTKPPVALERGIFANDLLLRIVRAEASYQNLAATADVDRDRLPSLKARVQGFDREFWETCGNVGKVSLLELWATFQELFSMATGLCLPRDNRRLEPMRADIDEFSHAVPLSLIDVMPTSRDLGIPGITNRDEAVGITQLLFKQIFQGNNASISEALERAGPGASSYIIPRVPELTTVAKGGRMDPKAVRVRMLTEDMLVGIAKAFIEWPFRPTKLEMEIADFNVIGS